MLFLLYKKQDIVKRVDDQEFQLQIRRENKILSRRCIEKDLIERIKLNLLTYIKNIIADLIAK